MPRLAVNRFEALRLAIFTALGAAPLACGPGPGGEGEGSTSMATATSGGSTGAVVTTTGEGTTTVAPTTSGGSAEGSSESGGPGTIGPTSETGASETGSESGGLMCGIDGCVDPQPILQAGSEEPSGLVRCADGLIHRVEAALCVTPEAASNCLDPLAGSTCMTNDDCVEFAHGTCAEEIVCGFTAAVCGCIYGCATDADCGPSEVCLCAAEGVSTRSKCVPAGCTTDADCGGGACTAATDPIDAPQVQQFQCHADGDACCSDADCDAGAQCRFGVLTPGVWGCDFGADCGRPLRVDGAAHTAAGVARGDWQTAAALLRMPDAGTCAALAEHWLAMGLAEHASVGSFARFILQLLAVGAPASLVTAAQAALADEVEHARVCFAVAAAYGGEAVGPGPLPAACGSLGTSLEEVVLAAIAEACVGETLSALEVEEAAARATDPAVRAVLERIAADEARHAALGWEFVGWALARADAGLRARAAAGFAAAIASAAARASARAGDPSLRGHGVVDPGLRAEVVRGGLAAVVGPCTAAVLRAA